MPSERSHRPAAAGSPGPRNAHDGASVRFTSEEAAEIERAALIGTRRRAIAVPAGLAPLLEQVPVERRPLAALALVAQRRRLGTRPAVDPAAVETGAPPDDPRPVLPEAARASFRRFLTIAAASPDLHFSHALAAILTLAGLRVHPHDLPEAHKLDTLGACSGPFESWWLRQVRGREREAAPVRLTPEEWQEAKPAALREAMREWRAREPEAARLFAETIFPSAAAESRAALVEAMDVGASPQAAPFLERAAGDRSAKVREAAERTSALVPGLPAYGRVVERIAACFRMRRKALGLGRKALEVDSNAFKALAWDCAPRIRFSDLAAALELAPEELADAARVEHVPAAGMLLAFAAGEGRADLCRLLLARAGDEARACLNASDPLPKTMPLSVRRSLIAPLLDPAVYTDAPANPSESALALLRAVGGPLDADTIRAAAAAPGFLRSRDLLAGRADCAETWAPRAEITGIACLAPPQAAAAVLEALSPLSADVALRPVFAYLRFLADLAKAGIRLPDDPGA